MNAGALHFSWWHCAQFFAKDGLRDHPALSPPMRRRDGPRRIDDDAAVVRREDVSQQWIDQVNQWITEKGLVPGSPEAPQSPDPKYSHAWAISGRLTTTGSAMLVSDPQTPVWNSSMLYEFHICGKTFNARGVGDKDGHIGYWSLGALPVRSPLTGCDGSHAQDGRTRKGMWLVRFAL